MSYAGGMQLRCLARAFPRSLLKLSTGKFPANVRFNSKSTISILDEPIDSNHQEEVRIPEYRPKINESLRDKRSRLLYQSRKRGMLENGLLLSNFASKFLQQFDPTELEEYDKLINQPSNDWNIFYWAIGKDPVPHEFDSSVFRKLFEFAKNDCKQQRNFQPNLP